MTYPMQKNIRVPDGIMCNFYTTSRDDFNGGEPFLVEGDTPTVLVVIPAMSFKRIMLGGHMTPGAQATTSKSITFRIYGSVDGVHYGTDALVSTGFPVSAQPEVDDGTYITVSNSGEVWAPYYILVAHTDGVASRGYLDIDLSVTNL